MAKLMHRVLGVLRARSGVFGGNGAMATALHAPGRGIHASSSFCLGQKQTSSSIWQVRTSSIVQRQVVRSCTSQSTGTLGEILAEELKVEEEGYEKDEVLKAKTPADFTLTASPGDCQLELSKTYNGESISVVLSVTDFTDEIIDYGDEDFDDEEGQEADEDGIYEEEETTIVFNVHVTKDNKTLTFECNTDGIAFEVENIQLADDDGPLDVIEYEGPNFNDLEDDLQDGFIDYLNERGVDFEFVQYLFALAVDKEQREYMSWLENVKKFIEK
mmetsp:Transcript_10504/g.26654  ORF Transcript_10504/g.26654 Transcript_10504/m.26654 type:complete len:273 (+) Transcript_10504:156-974(+)|eukprot:CAMPEP_0198242816 /NCGR_PEP_ID=MMETSP1446-20131203/21381_1 /TAXON_ID=1461542 ORGANISM="Unidentified sp, Strain CCMP2111" /NCGR_SAMPLE_ID=MMETSP1446 /ASSEMBLY_ACC=CAM_ASM_001112 /LENGTH=272 /DNA_ID=CAMNT_0043926437 /DNA_START=103 /DNA_END=921 /DNA_ORIENTATION=-